MADALRLTECCDLLAVLDQLNTNALSDGRVGLLGLNTNLLENDTLGVGRATEGRRLESSAQSTLLIVKIRPFLILAVGSQLSSGVKTTGFASSHDCFVMLVGRVRSVVDGCEVFEARLDVPIYLGIAERMVM